MDKILPPSKNQTLINNLLDIFYFHQESLHEDFPFTHREKDVLIDIMIKNFDGNPFALISYINLLMEKKTDDYLVFGVFSMEISKSVVSEEEEEEFNEIRTKEQILCGVLGCMAEIFIKIHHYLHRYFFCDFDLFIYIVNLSYVDPIHKKVWVQLIKYVQEFGTEILH